MVRAILAGTKTQTRRIVKPPQPSNPEVFGVSPVWGQGVHLSDGVFRLHAAFNVDGKRGDRYVSCPYGAPGDRLWVREAHILDPPIDGTWPSVGDSYGSVENIPERFRSPKFVLYRATVDQDLGWSDGAVNRRRWSPSIHMPRWASRITLEVTDVRVQRLQEISEEDAEAEGIFPYEPGPEYMGGPSYFTAGPAWFCIGFSHLWDSINGKRAPWASNPWVWAVSFRRLEAAA